LLKRLRARF